MNLALALAPGLACTPDLFAAQVDALADREFVFIDTRRDETLAAMAARFLATAPERFALAGLSMGGYLALEILRQAPARVAGLALLDTSARPDSEEATQRRRALISLAEGGDLDAVHAALWPRLVHPARLADTALEARVRGMLDETGAEAFVRQQRAIIGRMDSRQSLAAIACPTLVVVGEEDAITPPEMAEELAAEIAGATLVVVPECGHLSTLERPDAVSRALTAWLVEAA